MSQSMSLCVRACAALVLSVCAVAQETGEVSVLRAVRGREARLPCGPGRVFLDGPGSYVLWLKNERDILHRYPSERPDHPSVCVQEQCAEGTALVLRGVTELEAGRYRCRVHYAASPSVDYVLQLRLVESPGAPRIYDGARCGPERQHHRKSVRHQRTGRLRAHTTQRERAHSHRWCVAGDWWWWCVALVGGVWWCGCAVAGGGGGGVRAVGVWAHSPRPRPGAAR